MTQNDSQGFFCSSNKRDVHTDVSSLNTASRQNAYVQPGTLDQSQFDVLISTPVKTAAMPDYVAQGEQLLKAHRNPYKNSNTLDQALNAMAMALELNPDNVTAKLSTIKIHLKNGNAEKTETLVDEFIALHPYRYDMSAHQKHELSDAYKVKGFLSYKARHYDEALYYLKEAVRLDPLGSSFARVCLYKAYAEVALTAKFSKDSENSGTFKQIGLFARTGFHMAASVLTFPFEKEKLPLASLTGLVPSLIQIFTQEGLKKVDVALEKSLRLYERYPGVAYLSNLVGDLYLKKGHMDEALHWYQKTLARHPGNEDARYQSARILEQREDYSRVQALYETLLAMNPNDAYLHCNLGNVAFYQNDQELALSHYKMAYALGHDDKWRSLLAQSIGNIYNECMNDSEPAKMAYQMAIDLNPTEIENYVHLGLLYYKHDDYTNAEQVYKKALTLKPGDPSSSKVYSNMGYLRWIQGDVNGAVRYYENAINVNPEYEIAYNNLGVLYLDTLGDVRQAIALMEKAVVLNEYYALAYYNLGRAYSFMEETVEAARCYQQARRINASTKELDNDELDARINYLFETPVFSSSVPDSFSLSTDTFANVEDGPPDDWFESA